MNKIGFIGLGKLGLECAVLSASSKNEVHGFDIFARDSDRVIIHQDIKDAVIDKNLYLLQYRHLMILNMMVAHHHRIFLSKILIMILL